MSDHPGRREPVNILNAQGVGDCGTVPPQCVSGFLPYGEQVTEADLQLDEAQGPRGAGGELPEAVPGLTEAVDGQRLTAGSERAEEGKVAYQTVSGVAHQVVPVLEGDDPDPQEYRRQAAEESQRQGDRADER